ncbi:MAG TPA: tetratricopeptide repeat protein [Steroidobacteraceae bacterium]
MYLIPILSIAIQAGLIVHVIKTGRNMLWILAIALLPLVGSLAYAVVEILPQLLGGRAARRAHSGVRRMIDPDRELRRAADEVEISGNVDARRRLAEELFERGRYDAAIEVYEGGLKGIFEHDPTLLLGAARAHFSSQDFGAARAALERLTLHNPDFKSADAQLLYARALEAQDALDEAERVYADLAPGYPGAEARLRYGLLLKRRGKLPAANRVLKDLLDGAKLGPAHYRRAQAEWLERARRELS